MRRKDGGYCFFAPEPRAARPLRPDMGVRLAVVVLAVAAGIRFGDLQMPTSEVAQTPALLDDLGFAVDATVTGSINSLTVIGPVEPNRMERVDAKRRLVAALQTRSFLQLGSNEHAADARGRVGGKTHDRIAAPLPTEADKAPLAFAEGTEWQARSFIAINVLDGRTFRAGDIKVRLVGVELPASTAKCRLLDGSLRSCADRAEAQLDLTTRRRKVDCDVRPLAGSTGIYGGKCRIGDRDLNDQLIHESWAKPVTAQAPSTGPKTVHRAGTNRNS
ncbi:MAG: hypothetical protein KDJ16_14125 [Hyphomicrobiales bacterium]|nr:hypothetical protein [Hyphomicrobiales bacterium]